MGKSRFTEPLRWTVPRGAFLTWVWLALPMAILASMHCPGRLDRVCHAYADSIGVYWLLPTLPVWLLAGVANDLASLAVMLGFSVAMHLLLRRLLAQRVAAWVFGLFVVAWLAVGPWTFVWGLEFSAWRFGHP